MDASDATHSLTGNAGLRQTDNLALWRCGQYNYPATGIAPPISTWPCTIMRRSDSAGKGSSGSSVACGFTEAIPEPLTHPPWTPSAQREPLSWIGLANGLDWVGFTTAIAHFNFLKHLSCPLSTNNNSVGIFEKIQQKMEDTVNKVELFPFEPRKCLKLAQNVANSHPGE